MKDSELELAWDRWQKGESLNSIARDLDRGHSAVQGAFAKSGDSIESWFAV